MKNLALIAAFIFLVSRLRAGGYAIDDGQVNLSYLGREDLPRGMRNNNPGNIRISDNAWRGKIPESQNTDGSFEQFELYSFGVRAMIKLVRDTYINRDGQNTIRQIISRYAPSNENDTTTYIDAVVSATGKGADERLLTDYGTMSDLITAMAKHENGRQAFTPVQFSIAWELSNN